MENARQRGVWILTFLQDEWICVQQQLGLSYLSGRGQSVRYILRWLPLATLLKTFACHTYMPGCAVYILRLTGGLLGARVLHVTKDLVPCACLPACLPEYGGMLRKTKAGLKGFLDSTSWAHRFRHRPTVGQHWSEWAALRLVTVFNAHPKLLQVI